MTEAPLPVSVEEFMAPPPAPGCIIAETLPNQLMPFAYIYRMAVRKQMPAAAAHKVIGLVEEAAAIVLGELRGRMWQATLPEHIEELERMHVWFSTYTGEEDEASQEDPYAESR